MTDVDRRRGGDLLRVGEVATLLNVSAKCVRAHINAGRLPACKPFGEYRVRRADVEALLVPAVPAGATLGDGAEASGADELPAPRSAGKAGAQV